MAGHNQLDGYAQDMADEAGDDVFDDLERQQGPAAQQSRGGRGRSYRQGSRHNIGGCVPLLDL
jgi:hypothetical protein